LLRTILAEQEWSALARAAFAEGHAGFRALLRKQDQEPLEQALAAENEALLRQLLERRDYDLLRRVAFAEDFAVFRELATREGGEPLRAALYADDDQVLRSFLAEKQYAVLHGLVNHGHGDLLADFLIHRNARALRALMARHGLLPVFFDNPGVAALLALETAWREVRPLFPQEVAEQSEHLADARASIKAPGQAPRLVLEAVTRDGGVQFADGRFHYTDRHAFWTLLHEIMLNEDYFFEPGTETPRIIDCGAHYGMSLFYFKTRFPNARITAFEPVPALRDMALANCAANGFTNVEILPYALAPESGKAVFHVSDTYSMAGSLVERRRAAGDEVQTIEVACRPLSVYLDEPVDFLKMDIEGPECEVLEEAAPRLHNVRHLFCEFHQGLGLESGRLARILALLDQAGFTYHVGKSHNFQQTSKHRPMAALDGMASMVIWAKQKA
jgi:FkbM family methyltransferase